MKKLTKAECICRLSTWCDGTPVMVGNNEQLWIASVRYRNNPYHDVQIFTFDHVKLSELSVAQLRHIVQVIGMAPPMSYCIEIRRGENGMPYYLWSKPVNFQKMAEKLCCVKLL